MIYIYNDVFSFDLIGTLGTSKVEFQSQNKERGSEPVFGLNSSPRGHMHTWTIIFDYFLSHLLLLVSSGQNERGIRLRRQLIYMCNPTNNKLLPHTYCHSWFGCCFFLVDVSQLSQRSSTCIRLTSDRIVIYRLMCFVSTFFFKRKKKKRFQLPCLSVVVGHV